MRRKVKFHVDWTNDCESGIDIDHRGGHKNEIDHGNGVDVDYALILIIRRKSISLG